MKKSPFSTPRGGGNRQGFGWNSGGSPGRGYGRPKNQTYYSPNRSQNSSSPQSFGEDFIPFDNYCTTPTSDRKSTGSWQSPGSGHWQGAGRGNHRQNSSPAYNNYRDRRPRGNHHQHSPYYKDSGSPFRGNRKSFHRSTPNRRIDISQYMNLQSFLEDPWAELSQKMHKNENCGDTTMDTSSDFSFNSGVFDAVRLNDSVDEENLTSSQEGIDDSYVESETSFLPTSQDSIDISSESSLDPKTSQDSKD